MSFLGAFRLIGPQIKSNARFGQAIISQIATEAVVLSIVKNPECKTDTIGQGLLLIQGIILAIYASYGDLIGDIRNRCRYEHIFMMVYRCGDKFMPFREVHEINSSSLDSIPLESLIYKERYFRLSTSLWIKEQIDDWKKQVKLEENEFKERGKFKSNNDAIGIEDNENLNIAQMSLEKLPANKNAKSYGIESSLYSDRISGEYTNLEDLNEKNAKNISNANIYDSKTENKDEASVELLDKKLLDEEIADDEAEKMLIQNFSQGSCVDKNKNKKYSLQVKHVYSLVSPEYSTENSNYDKNNTSNCDSDDQPKIDVIRYIGSSGFMPLEIPTKNYNYPKNEYYVNGAIIRRPCQLVIWASLRAIINMGLMLFFIFLSSIPLFYNAQSQCTISKHQASSVYFSTGVFFLFIFFAFKMSIPAVPQVDTLNYSFHMDKNYGQYWFPAYKAMFIPEIYQYRWLGISNFETKWRVILMIIQISMFGFPIGAFGLQRVYEFFQFICTFGI